METKPKFNFKYLLGISLVSAMGGLLFGYDLVVIGGAKEFYELVFNLSTPAIKGWAISSCIVGCIIGAMGVGKPSDAFGRKKLLIIAAMMFFVSAIGSGYAPTFTQFVFTVFSPICIRRLFPSMYSQSFLQYFFFKGFI